MKRQKHSLSHYTLQTMDMGLLYPCAWYEVLPGDTVQQASSALVRVSPLVAPVMHPVSVRIHHWFVPNRLIWDGWEKFITGGADGLGEGTEWPWIEVPNTTGVPAKQLLDYLGVPPMKGFLSHISALPVRAYNLIYNEYYRDQDLVAPVVVAKNSGQDTTSVATLKRIAWEKDYFTSSRPWPQKGPDVSLPLGVTAPVIPDPTNNVPAWITSAGPSGIGTNVGTGNVIWGVGNQSAASPGVAWSTPGLIADLTNATATNVNDVRRAFALQRYQEARAMFGSRYTEYLRYLGVRSSDARLQRPEYLGGGKQTISFTEVLRTGRESDETDPGAGPIGEMKGHGIAAMRSRRYRRFFEEHGVVLSLASVRPRTMYADGVHRGFFRATKEDYWQRELEQIGQQEVKTAEVFFANAPADQATFSYQDRYSEYRHLPSRVAGEFRNTLNYWHLGRIFAGIPTLNQSFVECDPSKRIHAVTDAAVDTLWCMFSHSIQARRMVRRAGTGRIL